jgi:sugar lactone lactonase YvrE
MTPTHDGTWQTLTAENSGLPATHVTDIVEDGAGNLWFATYGGGLCRRSPDGRDWQTYRAGDGALVNDYVGTVAVDAAGHVWAVCDARKVDGVRHAGGVCTLSPDGAWQTYEWPASEPCIVALEPDRTGTLWLRCGGYAGGDGATACDGIREGTDRFHAPHWRSFDGTTWTTYEDDRAAVAAWYPHRPSRTRLGWALKGNVVWVLETTEFQIAPTPIGLPGGLNLPGIPGIPGLGSFCCHYDLVTYDGQEWKKRAQIPGPFRYGELIVDRAGHKWVSLIMLGDIFLVRGVARLDHEGDDGEWTVFDKDTGLLNGYVVALGTDSRGNVWLSETFGDLSRWDGARWTHFPAGQDGRPDKDLGRCTEDRQGQVWFPSRAGAVVFAPSGA